MKYEMIDAIIVVNKAIERHTLLMIRLRGLHALCVATLEEMKRTNVEALDICISAFNETLITSKTYSDNAKLGITTARLIRKIMRMKRKLKGELRKSILIAAII